VNAQDVVFASDTKAYVIRYNSPDILIIDPSVSADDEANFITGTLSIAAYDPNTDDEVASPRASSGVIVDGKLFVLIDRLSTGDFLPADQGYVAVFDTATDTEIDTGKGEEDSVMGIPLGATNPTNIRYNEATGEIYVTGRGNIFNAFNDLTTDPYQGGLFAIDAETYNLNQLLDDGDATSNTMGFIERTLVISDEKAYVSLYANEAPAEGSRNTLHTFNTATGEIGEPVAATAGMQTGVLSLGPDGYLWVSVSSAATPGFIRLDTTDDSLVGETIITDYNPSSLVFLDTNTP